MVCTNFRPARRGGGRVGGGEGREGRGGGEGGGKTPLGHNWTLVEAQKRSNPSNRAEETSCVRVEQAQPDSAQLVRSNGANLSVMILHALKSTLTKADPFNLTAGDWVYG